MLATGGSAITVCDVRTGQVAHTMPLAPGTHANSMAFGPDQVLISALEREQKVTVRQTNATLDAWEDFPIGAAGTVFASANCNDVQILSGRRSTALQLTLLPAQERRSVKVIEQAAMGNVTVSADGSQIVTLTREGFSLSSPVPKFLQRRAHLHVWDRSTLSKPAHTVFGPDGPLPWSIAQCPVTRAFAVGCEPINHENAAIHLNIRSAQGSIDSHVLSGHSNTVFSLAYSPKGKVLFSGTVMDKTSKAAELARWDVVERTQTHVTP